MCKTMAHPKERRHVALGLTIVKTLLPIFAIWLVVSFGGKTAAERTMIGMRRLGFRTLASSHLKYALREVLLRLIIEFMHLMTGVVLLRKVLTQLPYYPGHARAHVSTRTFQHALLPHTI